MLMVFMKSILLLLVLFLHLETWYYHKNNIHKYQEYILLCGNEVHTSRHKAAQAKKMQVTAIMHLIIISKI